MNRVNQERFRKKECYRERENSLHTASASRGFQSVASLHRAVSGPRVCNAGRRTSHSATNLPVSRRTAARPCSSPRREGGPYRRAGAVPASDPLQRWAAFRLWDRGVFIKSHGDQRMGL